MSCANFKEHAIIYIFENNKVKSRWKEIYYGQVTLDTESGFIITNDDTKILNDKLQNGMVLRPAYEDKTFIDSHDHVAVKYCWVCEFDVKVAIGFGFLRRTLL